QAAASSGALTQAFDVTLGADSASLDSGVFSTGHNHLLVWFVGRSDRAASVDATKLTINNDSSALYGHGRADLTWHPATFSPDGDAALQTFFNGQNVPGNTAIANGFAGCVLFFPNYATTAMFKMILVFGVQIQDTLGNSNTYFSGGYYESLTAMSRLT